MPTLQPLALNLARRVTFAGLTWLERLYVSASARSCLLEGRLPGHVYLGGISVGRHCLIPLGVMRVVSDLTDSDGSHVIQHLVEQERRNTALMSQEVV